MLTLVICANNEQREYLRSPAARDADAIRIARVIIGRFVRFRDGVVVVGDDA